GAGELFPDDVLLPAGQRTLEDVEGVLGARTTVGGHRWDALRLREEHGVARDVADRRKRGGLGEVDPLQVGTAVAASQGRRESALAVFLDEILEDRARLGEHEAVVLDDGELPARRV